MLSGDEPPRRWGRPVPLAEVVRAAAAEVEDYRRVEVLVNDHLEVAGRAVADLAHLLAELIENATTFSPPTSEVRVRSHLAARRAARLRGHRRGHRHRHVRRRAASGQRAAGRRARGRPAPVDDARLPRGGPPGRSATASRSAWPPTPGGGLTALVRLPGDLVSERPRPRAVAAAESPRPPTPLPGTSATASREPAGTGARRAEPASADGRPAARRAAPWLAAAVPAPRAARPPCSVAVGPRPPRRHRARRSHRPRAPRPGRPAWRRPPRRHVLRPARPPARPRARRTRLDRAPHRPPEPWTAVPGRRDPERVRSMLSRFQASQRAGRAVATLPGDRGEPTTGRPPAPTARGGPVSFSPDAPDRELDWLTTSFADPHPRRAQRRRPVDRRAGAGRVRPASPATTPTRWPRSRRA